MLTISITENYSLSFGCYALLRGIFLSCIAWSETCHLLQNHILLSSAHISEQNMEWAHSLLQVYLLLVMKTGHFWLYSNYPMILSLHASFLIFSKMFRLLPLQKLRSHNLPENKGLLKQETALKNFRCGQPELIRSSI